jgi:sugar phosphate isomerase/epimerase
MMGDGIIDFASISSWVAAAGYTGPVEVEIFNQEVFDQDPALTVKTMKERWEDLVLPALEGRG